MNIKQASHYAGENLNSFLCVRKTAKSADESLCLPSCFQRYGSVAQTSFTAFDSDWLGLLFCLGCFFSSFAFSLRPKKPFNDREVATADYSMIFNQLVSFYYNLI